PTLDLGEREQKNLSNGPLILFLNVRDLSFTAFSLLHLGTPIRSLIRVDDQPPALPAPAGTPPARSSVGREEDGLLNANEVGSSNVLGWNGSYFK
ncbi:unnamed protein product, partial [Urochloa humidicola]